MPVHSLVLCLGNSLCIYLAFYIIRHHLHCIVAIINFEISQGDKYLTGISHVIVDEVHERTLLVSF